MIDKMIPAAFIQALRSGHWITVERTKIISILLIIMSTASLTLIWIFGSSPMTDALGRPIGTDFSGIWHAGKMVLQGDAIGAFDPQSHFMVQQKSFGNPQIDVYGWHYPPFFLSIAALLALMPYVPALLMWQGLSFALFFVAIRTITNPHNLLPYVVIAFPAVFVTLGHGHNAFLTAGLLGLGLYFRQVGEYAARPILAGILIGLLAYKPQFGLILPIILIMSGNWRTVASAIITVVLMCALVTAFWGVDIWQAFIKGSHFTRVVVLEEGNTGWHKIQTLFSVVRSMGGSVMLAYAAQAMLTLSIIAALIWLCIQKAPCDLINALTALGALLATPYSLDYDMTVLGISIAFAARYAFSNGFAPFEKTILAGVWIVPLCARSVMEHTGFPLGVVAMLMLWVVLLMKAFHAIKMNNAQAHIN